MFTFNGIESNQYVVVNKVGQSILPPIVSHMTTATRRPGAYDFGVSMGVRQFDVTVTVKAASYEELRSKVRQIASWLYQEELKPLVFSDELDKTYYARVAADTNFEELLYVGRGTITFLAPDPFAHGELQTQLIGTAKPVINFTRASEAYYNDALIATQTPRYGAGVHGQAIMIEEPVTNLLTTGSAPAQETKAVTAGTTYTLSTYGTNQPLTLTTFTTTTLQPER